MKKIGLFLSAAVIVTMLTPLETFALTLEDVSFSRVQNEYFFDDFSKYNGSNITTDVNETSIGYYGDDTYLEKYESDGNVAVTLSKYGSAVAMNGPRGGHDTVYNIFPFNVDRAHFEDAGKTLVFSYDAYIPYNTDGQQAIYSAIGFGNNGDMNGHNYLAAGGKVFGGASQYVMGYNVNLAIDGGASDWAVSNAYDANSKLTLGLTVSEGGRWVNMKTALQYDSVNKAYKSWNLVDGQPIKNSATNGISVMTATPTSDFLATIQNRNSLAFSISARCGTSGGSGKDVVIDNVAMYLCDAAVPEAGEVNGKTIEIPFQNGFNFSDSEAAPECVKKGYLNIDTAANATVRYTDGTEITDAMITAKRNRIQIKLPSSVGEGDKVQIDLTGVRDIAGNQVGLDQNEYTIGGGKIIENLSYYENFETVHNALSEVGYSHTYTVSGDPAIYDSFIPGTTTQNGKGMQVNYSAATSSKAATSATTDAFGFKVSTDAFETAGKEVEYGYDIYIPDGVYTGETLCGYLVLADSNGNDIQFCSELPTLVKNGNSLTFKAINGTSFASDWPTYDTDGTWAANNKFGINQADAEQSIYTDYVSDNGWVSVKTRVSYVKDRNGTGYYLTKYFINGELIKRANGTPTIFKIQESSNPATRKYMKFSIWGNNGDGNPGQIIVDNVFANIVDQVDGEFIIHDFALTDATASFNYANLSTEAKPYQLIIACYEEGADKLIDVDINSTAIISERTAGSISRTYSGAVPAGKSVYYRAFLWDSLSDLNPIGY